MNYSTAVKIYLPLLIVAFAISIPMVIEGELIYPFLLLLLVLQGAIDVMRLKNRESHKV